MVLEIKQIVCWVFWSEMYNTDQKYVYKQLLLSSIEYCSAIWDPYHHSDINKLEMIQHYAAHFVLNKAWNE